MIDKTIKNVTNEQADGNSSETLPSVELVDLGNVVANRPLIEPSEILDDREVNGISRETGFTDPDQWRKAENPGSPRTPVATAAALARLDEGEYPDGVNRGSHGFDHEFEESESQWVDQTSNQPKDQCQQHEDRNRIRDGSPPENSQTALPWPARCGCVGGGGGGGGSVGPLDCLANDHPKDEMRNPLKDKDPETEEHPERLAGENESEEGRDWESAACEGGEPEGGPRGAPDPGIQESGKEEIGCDQD